MTINTIKSTISLEELKTVDDVFPMIITLNRQYGLWTDKDWKSIGVELIEASNNGYNELLAVFEYYYGNYITFIDKNN